MNTNTEEKKTTNWRLGYVISRNVGIICLILSAAGYLLETFFRDLKGLAFWPLLTAVTNLYIASISHSEYLNLQRESAA